MDLAEGTLVIKFFKQECGACRLYAPVFERAEARFPDWDFFELDTDESGIIARAFDIGSVPTTVILKKGDEVARVSGAISSRMLDNFLKGR